MALILRCKFNKICAESVWWKWRNTDKKKPKMWQLASKVAVSDLHPLEFRSCLILSPQVWTELTDLLLMNKIRQTWGESLPSWSYNMTVTLTLGALSTCLESLNSRGGQHPFVRPACGEAPMNKLSMCVHTYVQLSLRPLWTVALEAPLSMGFPRQEY